MTKNIKVSAIVSCYNGEKYLPEFLENTASQTIAARTEIVLVHNQPSQGEMEIVKNFQARYPDLINHIVVPREPLAVSTNRAIKQAKGEYICIWNIDDLRTPDSLELQEKVLDKNPDAAFTWGDFIIVHDWGKQQGSLVTSPEWDKRKFIQGMHLGPFYMWRKQLCAKIGYWDEQFKSGADYDYAARLAVEYQGKKAHGLLGYYLDEGLGLSTGKTPWQPIERTVIELRFGVYHRLDFWYYNRAKKYRIGEILLDSQWYPLEKFMPGFEGFKETKVWLVYAVLRYPAWLLKRVIKKLISQAAN